MKKFYVTALALLLYYSAAFSQHDRHRHDDCSCPKWEFEFSAGAWNSSMQGDLTANSLPGYINISLSDKLKSPDFSFFAEFEARKNKLILIGQFTSLYQTGNGTFVNSPYTNSRSTSRPLFIAAGLAFDFYSDRRLDIQLFGGARLKYIRNEIETYDINGMSYKEKETKGNIDPIAGGRFLYKPFECGFFGKTYLKGYFDVGGFGMVSFLTFQSYLAAGYEFNKNFSLRLGYRYLDVHYGTGTYLYDAGMQGFEFAATTRF